MTYQISIDALGSTTPEAFALIVYNRITTLMEYDNHEATVRAHAADPDMPPEDRWVSLAVPQAPAEVDAAIRRIEHEDGTAEFVPDYEIVGPSFEAKKAKLFQKVSEAEGAAINAIVPQGKVRAYQFREADIRKADQARYAEALKNSEPGTQIDFAKFTAEHRPEADARFLEEQAAREDRRQEIMRHAAQMHSDIEDLTPETIDAWEMKPVPA